MQRPERLVLLGLTTALSPVVEALMVPADPRPIHRLAAAGIIALAVATHATALHRMFHVIRALKPERVAHWEQPTGRGGVLRSAAAALLATGADFLLVLTLLGEIDPWWATGLGCLFGGAVNFTLNRVWTYASASPATTQLGRYVFVSASSAVLNAGSVAMLLLLPSVSSVLAWTIARLAVFLTWNYPLHREYVYAAPAARPIEAG